MGKAKYYFICRIYNMLLIFICFFCVLLIAANQSIDVNQAVKERQDMKRTVERLDSELKAEQETYVDITQVALCMYVSFHMFRWASKAQGSQHCVVSRQKDMTRQYKGMQEELLNRVNTLENTITHLKDQLGTNMSCSVWYFFLIFWNKKTLIYSVSIF